jgi:hypothetical protein
MRQATAKPDRKPYDGTQPSHSCFHGETTMKLRPWVVVLLVMLGAGLLRWRLLD